MSRFEASELAKHVPPVRERDGSGLSSRFGPRTGGSLPLSIIQAALGTRAIEVPIANYDGNQHAANENLRLGNLSQGIESYVALMMHAPL